MRSLGIIAIVIGVLALLLSLVGAIGQGHVQATRIAAVLILVAGIFLYRRQPAKS
jgi:hypothetical protein